MQDWRFLSRAVGPTRCSLVVQEIRCRGESFRQTLKFLKTLKLGVSVNTQLAQLDPSFSFLSFKNLLFKWTGMKHFCVVTLRKKDSERL